MPKVQPPASGAEALGDVARAVVRKDPPNADLVASKPPQRAPQERGHRDPVVISEQLDVGDARVVVDRNMQDVPADALVAIDIAGPAGDPVAEPPDAAKLLGVQVQQIARPGMLIALDQRRRTESTRREKPARRRIRAAVAALTPTALAIWAQVQRCSRSTFTPRTTAAAV